MAPIGFFFGAIVGLSASPALIFALRRGSWLVGLLSVSVPTAIAAYVGGLLTPSNDGPVLSFLIALACFLTASWTRGVIAAKLDPPPPPGACPQCRYDRTGLAPSAVCPECGAPVPPTQ